MNFEFKYNPVAINRPPHVAELDSLPEAERQRFCETMGIDPKNEGKIFRFRFANNYGASVVTHAFSYGKVDQWELAVIEYKTGTVEEDGEWDLTYDTPVTNDVIGHLDWKEVEEILAQIEALPEKDTPDNVHYLKA